MKTLIVEDDFTSRLLMQEFLKSFGSSHIAVNGREAVEAVRLAIEAGEPYDLICLDIMMPEMDGLQALKEIRGMEAAGGIGPSQGARIVMTTALADVKNLSTAYSNLCDAYLTKPIEKAKTDGGIAKFQDDPMNGSVSARGECPMIHGNLKPYAVVVNDDATQLNVLAGLVRKAGLDPLVFDGAEKALLEMDRDHPPALVVTDVHMPGIDGWRFCRLLRSPEYTAFNHIPILVVSAIFAGEEPNRIAADLGAEAFLPSPVDGRRFVGLVREILNGGASANVSSRLDCR